MPTPREIQRLLDLIFSGQPPEELPWETVRATIDDAVSGAAVQEAVTRDNLSDWIDTAEELLRAPDAATAAIWKVIPLVYLIDVRADAITQAQESPATTWARLRASFLAARLLERVYLLDDAVSAWDRAIATCRLANDASNLATGFMNRAVTLNSLGRLADAAAAYRLALSAVTSAGEGGEGIAWRIRLNVARFHLAQNEHAEAEQALIPALDILDRISLNIPDAKDRTFLRGRAIDVYRLLTYLTLFRGDRDLSFDLAQRAKGRLLAEMHELSVAGGAEQSMLDRRLATLQLRETWLLAQAGDQGPFDPLEPESGRNRGSADEALSQILHERAALRSELARVDPARALLATGAVRTFEVIAAAVGPNEALLDFLDLGPHGVGVTLLAGSARKVVWSGIIPNDDLESALSLWELALSLPADVDRADDALDWFGRILIEPCLSYLRGVTRLIISPSGRLHRIPFEAVRVRRDGRKSSYLVDLFEIGRVPTATSLSIERETHRDHARTTWPPAMVGAAPFSPTDSAALAQAVDGKRELRSGIAAPLLPGTGREVLGIASQVQNAAGAAVPAVCLLGPNATRAATVPLLPAARLVHLATHGAQGVSSSHGSSVQDFFLLFAASGDDQLDSLAMREFFDARLPLHDVFQVVLAACHLGSVVLQGEEAMGFVQAFLSAGTGVVFAPLWAVDDTATCELMLAYHEELLSNAHPTVGQAWGTAIGRLRENPEYEHPYYWAAWLPSGDIGLRLQPN